MLCTYDMYIICLQIRPRRSVGAGGPSGVLAFELLTFAKNIVISYTLLGGAFILAIAQEVVEAFKDHLSVVGEEVNMAMRCCLKKGKIG